MKDKKTGGKCERNMKKERNKGEMESERVK
jgi:hypothetical protein